MVAKNLGLSGKVQRDYKAAQKKITRKEVFFIVSCTYSIITSIIGLIIFRTVFKKSLKIDQEFDKTVAYSRKNRSLVDEMPFVSVLIPARNEQNSIANCVNAVFSQHYPNFEVIVVDDNSSDMTASILQDLQATYGAEKLRIIRNETLPDGWLGKNHALWQGYQQIKPKTEWLLFIDTDTHLQAGALVSVVSYACTHNLDLFSLFPGYLCGSFWHRLLLPNISKFYAFAANNPFDRLKIGSLEETFATGNFIMVRHCAYSSIGGHAAIKDKVVEDVELAQQFRKAGFTTLGSPYTKFLVHHNQGGLKTFWQSMNKNFFLVARKNWLALIYILVFEWTYILPPLCSLSYHLAKQFFGKKVTVKSRVIWLEAIAVALMLGSYSEMLSRYHIPRRFGLLYPLAAFINSLIIIDSSIQIGLLGRVNWKGRSIDLS